MNLTLRQNKQADIDVAGYRKHYAGESLAYITERTGLEGHVINDLFAFRRHATVTELAALYSGIETDNAL